MDEAKRKLRKKQAESKRMAKKMEVQGVGADMELAVQAQAAVTP